MRILFYDAKSYDKEAFELIAKESEEVTIDYLSSELTLQTADFANGYDAVCAFVSSDLSAPILEKLNDAGIKLILMRCAGYNNVDLAKANEYGMTVLRVPGYSPEAVAEHAMGLALAVNRRIHKEYIKVRENNFSLEGLTGVNFYQKTAGIVGTGKIGAAMARICHGFGMRVVAFDVYPNKSLDFIEYMSLEELLKQSDLISLHCPMTPMNYHLINKETISLMKDGVTLINTSRGGLVDTEDLIAAIRAHKFHGIGLDVYEEEQGNVFENREQDIMESSIVARLLSFPNVIITSHQAFLTKEALAEISRITIKNALDYANDTIDERNLCS